MQNELAPKTCIFSVDVEDWFHILDSPATPHIQEWDALPSRIERNLLRLFDLLDERDVSSTCFFLGWVARKFPDLVKEALRRGHEIASHGYAHRLVGRMTQAEFFEDACGSRKLLEDISGSAVTGFRAPGFSATSATPWFFDTVLESGYGYDSSLFPARHGHGGLPGAICAPHFIGELLEFPMTMVHISGRPLCFFGGGYLRLSPLPLVRAMAARVLAHGQPVIFYVHPREIDPEQPRLRLSLRRQFKSYVNVASTEKKVASLLADFEFVTFASLANRYRQMMVCENFAYRPKAMAAGK
jgi:polysaccharide deacetylase family protein (PEP-CTERM system associated)